MFDAQFAYELLNGIALSMARLYPCMFLVPAFLFKHLKGLPRYAVLTALALIPAPGIGQELSRLGKSWSDIFFLIFKEMILGTLMGLVLYLPFFLFSAVGVLLDNQRGALTGGQLNPALGADVTPLSHLFEETMIMLLMIIGGLPLLMQVIWDSYQIWPATSWWPALQAQGFDVYLGVLQDTFTHLLLYSAPFIALLLMVEAAMALIGIYSPQLNVFILAMPAKCVIGLAFLVIYLPTLMDLGTERLELLKDVRHTLLLMVPGPREPAP
ncbi:EscT/YscT/HrcT family type III secretion system export apparatus protein [Pseudomonas moraviensis]|jgi:type III secretion protein T|uniref:type III secretion system export apparatus subunit SctT n=1 Tax=Pseudomonas TaxID=286 RepID=UPI00135D2284|nr:MULTISPECIES: type III secretion system export apparatus subunit SctT [Pseudomonas]MXI45768.1 EscT/YscT/HrcT family type III secretion system export apparatus protein [Pseudomonas moraviensis]WLG62476.1 type III secretion system export apparatus subunit SctT [Pseudomonas sp. FP1762]